MSALVMSDSSTVFSLLRTVAVGRKVVTCDSNAKRLQFTFLSLLALVIVATLTHAQRYRHNHDEEDENEDCEAHENQNVDAALVEHVMGCARGVFSFVDKVLKAELDFVLDEPIDWFAS